MSDFGSDSDDELISPNRCWLTTPLPNGVPMLESNDLENSGEKSPGWGSLWSISPKEKNTWKNSPDSEFDWNLGGISP
jgi:hypothetical protein